MQARDDYTITRDQYEAGQEQPAPVLITRHSFGDRTPTYVPTS